LIRPSSLTLYRYAHSEVCTLYFYSPPPRLISIGNTKSVLNMSSNVSIFAGSYKSSHDSQSSPTAKLRLFTKDGQTVFVEGTGKRAKKPRLSNTTVYKVQSRECRTTCVHVEPNVLQLVPGEAFQPSVRSMTFTCSDAGWRQENTEDGRGRWTARGTAEVIFVPSNTDTASRR
jgi:hypothetical protein